MIQPLDIQIIRAGVRRTRIQMGCVGAGVIGLGAFMVALHALGLDPEAQNLSTVMVVLIYVVALGFVALGVVMIAVALFKSGRDLDLLERFIRDAPQELVSAQRMLATRHGIAPTQGEGGLGQHQARITAANGRSWVINGRAAQVTAILDLIARVNPAAEIVGR